MRHHEVIELLKPVETTDKYGNVIREFESRKVYANQYDVSINEFYQSSVAGLKPTKSFKIHTFEYKGEDRLKHNGTLYQINRVSTRGDNTTLICEVDMGGN